MKTLIYELVDNLGLVAKYVINGIIGGIVWSLYKRSKFVEALRQIIIGGAVSGYFTPVIAKETSLSSEAIGFTSFVVGMIGMVILDSIYKYLVKNYEKWRDAIFEFVYTISKK